VNDSLGFGGLVLSASSENLSVLLRALNESRRVEVLARPQVTTLDNQPAFIQVGQRVPFVTNTNLTQVGQQNSITLSNVGLILGVTPRISPDGLVVMEIDAERSELSPEPGVPISIAQNGDVLRSPIVNTTTAQTTVSALSGQTIVLGGLITKNKSQIHRRVPVLCEIPVLGNIFRYDFVTTRRTELLIIMTPRVVRSEEDVDIVKQVESSRMSWCLADVIKMHGPSGIRSRSSEWTDGEVPTIYPDIMPQGILFDQKTMEEVPAMIPSEQLPDVTLPPANTPNNNVPPPAADQSDPFSSRQNGTQQYDSSRRNPAGTPNRLTPAVVEPAAPANVPAAANSSGNANESQLRYKMDGQVNPATYHAPATYPTPARINVDPRARPIQNSNPNWR
jgi:general secretion pathway protein D